MNLRKSISLAALAAFTLVLTSCGGSSNTPPPPVTPTVSLSGQPASLGTGGTAPITATTSTGVGVTWTVTCTTSPCGSFSATSTPSGTATTYTAPSTAQSVVITAATSSGTAASMSATISITAPVIAVAFNPPAPASINAGATSPLTAVVSNDPKTGGVTWKVTCGSSACGSFNPTSTASGTATTYTAPAIVPSPNSVTVTATSVTDTTKTATANITIGAPLADGTYVYHFSGFDSTGPSFFAGAFTVSGGVITAGEQDFSDVSFGDANDQLVPSKCSISGSGNTIQIVLAVSNTSVGVSGIETIRGATVSSSRVLISEFDTFGAATGSVDLQTTPVAAPSGGYAFVVSGLDINNSTSPATTAPLSIGGILNFTGTSLSISNSIFDYNFNLQPALGQLFTGGSITQPDSFGRVILTLTPTSTSGVPAFVLVGYILSPGQMQLVESLGQSQGDLLNDDLGGMALGQGSNAGKFALSSLSGTTYVFAASGQDINNFLNRAIANFGGNLSFSANGGITGTLAINDGAAFVSTGITSGTFIVDPTGRATLSQIITSQFPTDSFAFQLYLDGNGNALLMGVDTLEATAGPAYLKTATSNDFEGTYALSGRGVVSATGVPPPWGAVGPVTLSSDNLTGTTDYNTLGSTPIAAQAVAGTENSTTGTLSVTGLDSTALTTSRLYSYFPIDGKRVFAIETDGQQIGILALESTSH